VLAVYAGTGKTTIVNHIIETLGLSETDVITVAHTGKAAYELIKKGTNAATVASAFYRAVELSPVMHAIDCVINKLENKFVKNNNAPPIEHVANLIAGIAKLSENNRINYMINYINNAPVEIKNFINTVLKESKLHNIEIKKSSDRSTRNEVIYKLRDTGSLTAKLIIIDESFMLNDDTIADITKFNIPIIFTGDFFQLEPIYGENSLVEEVDITLVDITRQAADNPIIKVTLDLRNGKMPAIGNYGNKFLRIKESDFFKNEKLAQCIYSFDQIIAGKNKTCNELNHMIREGYGYVNDKALIDSRLPQIGEKIICTKNNLKNGIVNGTLARVNKLSNLIPVNGSFNLGITTDSNKNLEYLTCNAAVFIPEIESEYNIFYKKLLSFDQFDFGYCLTNHKFQGSSAPRIVVFEEAFGRNPLRWYYTAWTRAEDTVISLIS
jgi:exodeoxyribonuclease-5